MKTRFIMISVLFAILTSSAIQAQTPTSGLVKGWEWHYDGMANNPGLCVIEVDQYVVLYRVECNQPEWKTVIWEGLPNPGDYIDTLGANWVKVQAFYSFPPGVHQLVGIGVHVKHAEYPSQWTKIDRLRKKNTIRIQNPDWDFTFRNSGMSFDPCLRRAEESNYRVREPWGGPRFDRESCNAVEGDWDWFNGGHVRFHEGGVVKGINPDGTESGGGLWKCIDSSTNTIEIRWEKGGWVDTLRLTPDGNRLEGENQFKNKVWAVRAKLWELADCRAAMGTWKWFNGGTVILDEQGGVTGYDKGSDRPVPSGKWRCMNGSPVTIQIQWVKGGWLDTLVLSSDGRKLEGTNQLKYRVWAERQ